MPPKKQTKADQKKKEKVVEDKTFGLKNKNRSKAVQKFVSTVSNNVTNNKQREMEAEKKRQAKMEKQAKEAEMRKMYGGIDRDPKLLAKKKAEEEAAMSAAAAAAAERGEYLWTADDFEDIEADDTRLEEQLESEREALVGRTDLTPVNEETFQKWWSETRASEAKAAEKARKSMLKKFKQTGRGISGRELFAHDATLFVDDAAADETIEREELEEAEEDAKAEDEGLFDGEEDLPDEE